MERILIIGCSGAGKSTLSRLLSSRLHLPVVHLDQLWWKAGWENYSKAEFDQALDEALCADRWIMDGNFDRTLPVRLARCDTVIYLDYSRLTCIWSVLRRTIRYYGGTRPDMTDGCPERFDPEFIAWIWNFNRLHKKKLYQMLKTCGKQVFIFRRRGECERFVVALETKCIRA